MTANNILVVDDEIGIRELLSEILKDEGYNVKVAENAAVWVSESNVRHRVIYFLCQHLALVIRASDLVGCRSVEGTRGWIRIADLDPGSPGRQ